MHPIVAEIENRSPAGIAAALGRLIGSGRLAPGDRLPTVRDLAAQLEVSPATISAAWQAVAGAGLIVSRGRSGTFVLEQPQHWLPTRSKVMAGRQQPARIDLSKGTPDPALLPALGPALGRVSQRAVTASYHEVPVIPELLALLSTSWPYPVEDITVVDGALDALSRSLEAVTRFGDRVVVESPGFPPFFDLLDQLGLTPIPVPVDANGIEPEAFAAALRRGPSAVILQPRAHNPTGASMTVDRARDLAQLLEVTKRAADTVVIEDDHSGDISTAADVSLGHWLPDRVLHIRSYSKSHGPDLRIAALGGPTRLLDPIVARRMLGPGWTSRMLQTILHELLSNPESIEDVAEARRVYARRQSALVVALASHGISIAQPDGINLWLPVLDERDAIVHLAAHGIRVAAGSPFVVEAGDTTPHVRVTAGALENDVEAVAHALAGAARPQGLATGALATRWS
ncbi:PLP-dependent aminotransferase family protein [Salinibacterium hongtaonis]|uniref:aminotransferase-like domain-containing protein n=1 Tax=Homoserinimonas hongtaonis TaxID=2079791 RepID=UPI000D3C2071|nr:aminotransferase class I/II-fold pyridoxal phosphate-dependent enzyme [Salinibacterium hongtaonis]AWB90258.1 GntR family transcriptional regulator [Salinibacterium hongtaonis]